VNLRTVDEPGRVASGALAVLVHLMFFSLLVFGLSWQKKIAGPVVVDLWQDLPEPVKKVSPPPETIKAAPKPAPLPPKPVPEVKKEPVAPPPKVEAPKPSAADIELKEKLRKQKEDEAARREEEKKAEAERREEQKKAELERRRLEEEQKEAQKKAETERREEQKKAELEKRRLEEEQKEEQKRADEAKREEDRKQRAAAVERDRQQQEAARKQREAEETKRRAEAAARAAHQKLIDDWKARIQARIKSRVVVPPNMEGNPEARFEVVLLPGGEVLNVTMKKSSGNKTYDDAVERAITSARTLPVPDDPDLFQENFRELTLVFRPKD